MAIKLKIKNALMVLMCLVILLPFLNNSGTNNAYAAYEGNVTPENQQIEGNVTPENQQIEGNVTPENQQIEGNVTPENQQIEGNVTPENQQIEGNVTPENQQIQGNVTPENQQIQGNVTPENQQIQGLPTYVCEGTLVDFSDSNSSIRLECGHNGYAWEHIWLKHVMGLHKEQGSRFRSANWGQRDMLKISMEIINNATTLDRHPSIDGRASKTAWSSYNNSKVKVVIQDTGRKNGYGGIVWNIVTVYPIY